jgi:predicted transcriptional regulator
VRIEIIALILQIAVNGTTPTKLAYLSYEELNECLIMLKENDMLLEYPGKKQPFIITAKGQNFLQLYIELNDLVTVTNRRNVTAVLHSALLRRANVVEHYTVYSLHYLMGTIRLMIQKLLIKNNHGNF